MWKSAPETESALGRMPGKNIITDLWALHYFAEYAVFSPNYKTDDTWADILVLSACGRQFLEQCGENLASFTTADLYLAVFGFFYYHDVLIDHDHTDVGRVLEKLNGELGHGLIKWPYLFGRLLYDRFNDSSEADRTDHLEPEETQNLLRDTPAGVYQVGTFVSGPYGIISSAEERYMPPTNRLPLWHCSDTGCRALHTVFLTPVPVPPVQAYNRLENKALEGLGPRSEWSGPLNRLFRPDRGSDGRPYYDLPVLIGNAIVGPERAAVVAAALRSARGSALRDLLARVGVDTRATPEEIAQGLGEAEQLQLLLTLADAELQALVDACVLDRRIDIPINEIRTSQLRPPRLSNRDRPSELSSLGLRFRPRVPLASLHSVIWESYEALGLLEELGWKLRRRPGLPPRSALMDFIRANHPERAVSELVLTSMPVSRRIAERFGVSQASIDRAPVLAELLLWKLGFDPTRFPDQYARLRTRIDEFTATALSVAEVRSEEERERLRGVGVNLFVSVEQLIQELVSYNTWLLAADHFLSTRFTYDAAAALAGVPSVLGSTVATGPVTASWSTDGDNALGTLVAYMQRMLDWMERLKTAGRAPLLRPGEDLPHYADDPEQTFVFRHTQLWADADAGELDQYVQGAASVVTQLNRAEVALVRNGLDHKRDDRSFPKSDVMLACAARIREALDIADARRYVPKLFWLQSVETDRFGREEYMFRDYRGKEITIGGPPVVSGLPKPRFRTPVLIAAGNLLGEPNAELRFAVRDPSAHAEYWAGYPRRRHVPSPHRPGPDEETPGERIV